MKKVKIIALFIIICAMFGCDPLPVELVKSKSKYMVKVGNNMGHEIYDCDSYERPMPGTYDLFDRNKKLIIEITITNGYYIEISPNSIN